LEVTWHSWLGDGIAVARMQNNQQVRQGTLNGTRFVQGQSLVDSQPKSKIAVYVWGSRATCEQQADTTTNAMEQLLDWVHGSLLGLEDRGACG
jgi:hypothetical protein